jgi:hypothetical protein
MSSPVRLVQPPESRPWGPHDGLLRRVVASGARLLRVGDGQPRDAAAQPPPMAAPADGSAPAPPDPAIARVAWADRLWGDGLALPGGAEEVLRLASLLPLTPAHTLLLAGLGAQAAGSVVAGARGCFVAAHELPRGAGLPRRALAKRVTGATLFPGAPDFRRGYHHHAILLEPLRQGGTPDAMLRATATALRDGGEIVLLDLVATGAEPEPRWLAAEARQRPPAEAAMAAGLEHAGFRIHVVEDAGARHQRAVLLGWVTVLEALRTAGTRPSARAAAALVAEAEAWMLRLRLLRDGRLRLLRWHATMVRRPG